MAKNKTASNAGADSPADLADEYIQARGYQMPEGLALRKHRGGWLRYDGKVFRGLSEEELRADITRYFGIRHCAPR